MSLAKTQAVAELAEVLSEYLPGKPHPFADAAISFPGVAHRLGFGAYWPRSGSKTPSVRSLLSAVLEHQQGRFCTLVLEVVRVGIGYRSGKQPITRQDIEILDALVRRVGFGIREFRDPAFLRALPERVVGFGSSKGPISSKGDALPSSVALADLRRAFLELAELAPVVRGLKFETVLGSLFDLFGMAPRSAFRLVGEQIDGSFALGDANYLVEAKWHAPKLGQEQLLVFSGKVGGKAEWSRGLFVSYSGFTAEGLEAFRIGKRTNIVCMDRNDLDFVLSGRGSLPEVMRRKVRRATESNDAFVPARALFE